MRRLTAILILTWLSSYLPAHAQWTRIDTFKYGTDNSASDRPHGIKFISKDTGYAFERNNLRTTWDSGHTWHNITPALAKGSSLRVMSWPKGPAGYVVVHDSADFSYRVLKTINSGYKWDTLPLKLNDTVSITEMRFANAKQGIIGGLKALYKTSDGGLTWTAVAIPPFSFIYVNRISMPDTSRLWIMGYFATGSGGARRLLHSTDFGATWDTSLTSLTKPGIAIVDLYAFNNNNLLAVSDSGNTYLTHNGGKTWTYNFTTSQISADHRFTVPDFEHCYLFSPYFIYASRDSGNSFRVLASPPFEGSFLGTFTDSITGYVISTAQTNPSRWNIYKTYNGGRCATLIFPTALHVCSKSSFPLTYFTGVKNPVFKAYNWSPSTFLDAPNKAYPVASPATNITYTLTINYNSMSNCPSKLEDSVKVYVAGCDSVWPGDANADLLVDENDVLNIGLAYGTHGYARALPYQNDSFKGRPATNWTDSFQYGINYKHTDCNGDGLINADDTTAIIKNFNKTHTSRLALRESNAAWPTLWLHFNKHVAHPGDHVTLTLGLYNSKNTVDSIYGMAFGLQLDPNLVDTSTLNVDYSKNFFTGTGNSLHTSKYYRNQGALYSAITRINHTNQKNDTGIVCVMDIVIIDNLAGVSILPPHLSGRGYFITASGDIQPYNLQFDTLYVYNNISTRDVPQNTTGIHIYPTESTGHYRLHFNGLTKGSQKIRVINLIGDVLYSGVINDDKADTVHDITLPLQAPPGMYWVEVTDNINHYISPVIKINP